MEILVRLLLGAVLVWAGVAKLRRRTAFSDGLHVFGVPPVLRGATTHALIVLECALGALLLAGIGTRATALATAVLATGFVAALVGARLRGHRRIACRCFGSSRQHLTSLMAARAALVAVAALAVAVGIPAVGADAMLAIAVAVLTVAVLVLALLVLALYRQVGVLSQRLSPAMALEIDEEGPPLNAAPPPLEGLAGRGAELVTFVSVNCRLCHELLPAFSAVGRDGVVVRAVEEESAPETFENWNVPGTPFVALVIDGVVRAKGLVNTLEQIDGLIDVGRERARGSA